MKNKNKSVKKNPPNAIKTYKVMEDSEKETSLAFKS